MELLLFIAPIQYKAYNFKLTALIISRWDFLFLGRRLRSHSPIIYQISSLLNWFWASWSLWHLTWGDRRSLKSSFTCIIKSLGLCTHHSSCSYRPSKLKTLVAVWISRCILPWCHNAHLKWAPWRSSGTASHRCSKTTNCRSITFIENHLLLAEVCILFSWVFGRSLTRSRALISILSYKIIRLHQRRFTSLALWFCLSFWPIFWSNLGSDAVRCSHEHSGICLIL